ncbi:MAG: phytanoyl-CoA dioxygenase family protein [Roseibacillus sp.]
MPLVVPQPSPLLANGFQFLPQVFTEQELTAARHGQEELMAGRTNREPTFDWQAPRARKCRSWKTPYSTHFRSELAALAHSPQLLEKIAQATGAQSLRLWFDQLLWEEPSRRPQTLDYHWHTERSRWKTCQANLMLTAWVPLAHITPAMGPITMANSTSQRKWLELPDGWQPDPADILPAPVQPGDAALFCWHTVHGNPPNLGNAPRRAIALHYAIDDLRYQPYGKFSHLNERVVGRNHNLPDFTDEQVVPRVWKKD